jgi:hypothetical protein
MPPGVPVQSWYSPVSVCAVYSVRIQVANLIHIAYREDLCDRRFIMTHSVIANFLKHGITFNAARYFSGA